MLRGTLKKLGKRKQRSAKADGKKKFLKKPDKDEQTVGRKKEITKIRAEINEIETTETMGNITETKS